MEQKPFEIHGEVEDLLIASDQDSLISKSVEKITVFTGYGIKGDKHAGRRLADVRERAILSAGLPKGIEITNLRQYSAVSHEELYEIAAGLHMDTMPHGYLGENLILSGIPRLSKLPPGTLLFFHKPGDEKMRTASLIVWAENMPCTLPGKALSTFTNRSDMIIRFPKVAMGRRGVVGAVFSSGTIHKRDAVVVKIPQQRIYAL